MKRILHSYGLPAAMAVLISLSNCSRYEERGHANTPPENPGSQIKTGIDTFSHPGNIDKDSIHLEK
jgi:hypothetical protein